MDSDDWEDLGDNAVWSTGPGLAWTVILIVVALICYRMASSTRSEENRSCAKSCGSYGYLVVKTNSEEMTCMCRWENGSLHVPTPKSKPKETTVSY